MAASLSDHLVGERGFEPPTSAYSVPYYGIIPSAHSVCFDFNALKGTPSIPSAVWLLLMF